MFILRIFEPFVALAISSHLWWFRQLKSKLQCLKWIFSTFKDHLKPKPGLVLPIQFPNGKSILDPCLGRRRIARVRSGNSALWIVVSLGKLINLKGEIINSSKRGRSIDDSYAFYCCCFDFLAWSWPLLNRIGKMINWTRYKLSIFCPFLCRFILVRLYIYRRICKAAAYTTHCWIVRAGRTGEIGNIAPMTPIFSPDRSKKNLKLPLISITPPPKYFKPSVGPEL